jgi:hypothetical protein
MSQNKSSTEPPTQRNGEDTSANARFQEFSVLKGGPS